MARHASDRPTNSRLWSTPICADADPQQGADHLRLAEPYIGHLGLGGVGDTKGMLECALRDRDIRWVTNAKVDRLDTDAVETHGVGEDGKPKASATCLQANCMFIPAFRGVPPSSVATANSFPACQSAGLRARRQAPA